MKNEEVPTSQFHILSRWYYLSLLDLCTCKEFTDDPEWIAKRLGITPFEAKRAWQMLLQGRWVKRTETGWTKSNKLLSEGPCTEVYQLQVQLFPVTREVK